MEGKYNNRDNSLIVTVIDEQSQEYMLDEHTTQV